MLSWTNLVTKTAKSRLLLLGVLLFGGAANAGQVAYDYAGTGDDPNWTMSGTIVFDEIDLVPGNELIMKIVSWEFSWTNGTDTFSDSSTEGSINFTLPATFIVDANLAVEFVAMENNTGSGRHPLFAFEFNGDRFNYTTGNDTCCSQGSGAFSGPRQFVEFVTVDIKPGSDGKCNAVIPVAILGSDTLDATLIDPNTLSFAGVNARERGNGVVSCNIDDVNSDGYADIVCQYQNATAEGTVSGELFDGSPIQGSDLYCVAP
jgi:hypothetical protein